MRSGGPDPEGVMIAARERAQSFALPSGQPVVWLLMGHRAGDNTQVLALGEALGWPFEIQRFVYTSYEVAVNLPFTAWLAGVDKDRSSVLAPPWPDLVISGGRRNEPIARWIQAQARKPVRLVHVGRPWARIERFDLVVTTPQYRLPELPNVLHNETPLHRVNAERLAKEAAQWGPRLEQLPRPLIAVLVGGSSGPYPFDTASGARLSRAADAMAKQTGGSLLVTTSARTTPEATDALFAGIGRPAQGYRFSRNDKENPYYGFLGLADRVIVTADSVSMMAEACSTGRPVYLFDTGEGRTSMRPEVESQSTGNGFAPWNRAHLKAFVYRQTMRHGPQRLTRDIRIVQQRLVDSGRAAWLGDGEPAGSPPPLRDLERAATRVRALFDN
jgi:mitochondrial fission protein ELM1